MLSDVLKSLHKNIKVKTMQKLIDKKRFEAKCEYCRYVHIPEDRSIALCSKKGFVDFSDSCKKFRYDPLKRIPKKTVLNTDFSYEDFNI